MIRYIITVGHDLATCEHYDVWAPSLKAARDAGEAAGLPNADPLEWRAAYGRGKRPIVPKPLADLKLPTEGASRKRRRSAPMPVYHVWTVPGAVTIDGPIRGRAEADGSGFFAGLAEAKKAACWHVDMMSHTSREQAVMAKRMIRAMQKADIADGHGTVEW